MKTLFKTMRDVMIRGENAVLVTVTSSSGSVPRGAGAHMLVTDQGRVCGSIGGGPVERRAEQEAMDALRIKSSLIRHFQLEKNQVEDLGMVCGGEVSIWFHYLSRGAETLNVVDCALRCLEAGEQCWLAADLTGGGELTLYCCQQGVVGGSLLEPVVEALGNRPFQMELKGRLWYAEPLVRPGTVYIFGGGHVAQALVPVLTAVEFRCVVVEDRPEFCDPRLFPGASEVRLVEMERLSEMLTVDKEDYVCIMTRGHTNDVQCEAFALTTSAQYIGVMGSRRKAAWVNQTLKERGFTDEDLKRVTTPIGLPIRAESPAEIAVSIAAQLIQIRAEYAH